MFDTKWFTASITEVFMVFMTGISIFLILLLFTRLTGLRSFSKMSSFDFSITVAFGSIMATTVLSKDPSVLVGTSGLAVLYLIQYITSKLRRHSQFFSKMINNQPVLIMAGEQVISEHMKQVRVTQADLSYKLRAAGITHPNQILAVVLESTGDVSVLKHSDAVDACLFEGVKGAELLNL